VKTFRKIFSRGTLPVGALTAKPTRKRAFTLLQLITVTAIIALLAAISFGYLSRTRRVAQRSSCDIHLKALSLALDAYRQERGAYPTALSQLQSAKYITDPAVLHCSLDPRPGGSYEEYYLYRSTRPAAGDTRRIDALPLVVCPFHEEDGDAGNQAFARSTQQFKTQPASVAATSGATVERPGKLPIAARSGMALRGGDRIRTDSGGSAQIAFADGSLATLSGSADVTVLQTFLDGNSNGNAPLYTLLRQRLGDVLYKVHHGSKFDVATPTATAGALGTEFRIKRSDSKWYLSVIESRVLCTSPTINTVYTPPAAGSSATWNLIGTESRASSTTGNCGNGNGNGNGNGC
jgi:type II secretory pathway pseudopilin PulG